MRCDLFDAVVLRELWSGWGVCKGDKCGGEVGEDTESLCNS